MHKVKIKQYKPKFEIPKQIATMPKSAVYKSILPKTQYPKIALFLGCLNLHKSPISKIIIDNIFEAIANKKTIHIQPLPLLHYKPAYLKIQ